MTDTITRKPTESINYRYERKFLIDQLSAHQARVIIKLHPAMFIEPYPPRIVNNIYFDTKELSNYHDNVSGSADREKVRIRWYGDLFGMIEKPILEFKIKRGFVGTKRQYPLPGFILGEHFTQHYFQSRMDTGDLPPRIRVVLRDQDPVLLNCYYRRYYATIDGCYRVTVDTNLTFYNIRRLSNHFINRQVNHNEIIVELKYDREHDPEAHRVSSGFPFSVTKSSKYVQGVERVYL